MPRESISLPFGSRNLEISLPPGWSPMDICAPAAYAGIKDAAVACREALARPIGMPPLAELARGRKKITLVVDDISRPTPVLQFIEPVIEALQQADVPNEAVTMLTALGIHRTMTQEEMESKIGAAALQRYRWVNHNMDPGPHLELLGRTGRGTEVWFNRLVTEADLVIGLGCIEPHIIASFGGGRKIILPGVAGQKTVAANHAINTTPATFNNVGLDPDKNPMRQDLEEAVALLKPPLFIVNAVLRGDLSIARMVAGDALQAHREGCRTCAEIYGVKIPERADIIITSSHPMNHDLRQGLKAVANTIRALKPGGAMLALVACEKGIGDLSLPRRRLPISQGMMRWVARGLIPLVGHFSMDMKEEDRFVAYFALQSMKNYRLFFYTPTLPPELGERLPFLGLHNDLEAVLTSTIKAAPQGRVLVFPNGGVSYPVIENSA